MASAARRDIRRQQIYDRDYEGRQGTTLAARMKAVLGAQQAVARGEPGAGSALRQSLVDLAAISEALAEELPPPRDVSERFFSRR